MTTDPTRRRRRIRRPHSPEHLEAVALVRWRDLTVAANPELALLYAIPNGGQRSKAVAGKLKAEGVRAGVSDYHLPVARGGFFGLWVELKAEGGRPSQSQKDWIEAVGRHGHAAVVCTGWVAASEALLQYLALPPTIVMVRTAGATQEGRL